MKLQLSSKGLSYEQNLAAVGTSCDVKGLTATDVQYQPTEKYNKTKDVPSSYSQAIEQPCFTNTETACTTTVSVLSTNSSAKQAKTHTESYTMTAADSHCTSTGSENHSTITGIAETPAPVRSSMPQAGKLAEATEIVPDLQSGRVDAKKFRPRHYDIDSLEIGTWRVSMPNLFTKHSESFTFLICWLFEGSVYDMINSESMNFIVIF